MPRNKKPSLPANFRRDGQLGYKPVDPAATSTSESNVAVDVEPGVDGVDDAGPTKRAKQKRTRLDLSELQYACFVRAFPDDKTKTSTRCTICYPTDVSEGSAIDAQG